jgi:SseB protein N-terminal domain
MAHAPSVTLHPTAHEFSIMKFIPRNPLEEQLAAVHAGTLDPETFVLQLLDQQLFVPVRDEKNPIQGFQRSTQADPLIIEDEEGERVLAVFTSPERAKPVVDHYPEFTGGILTELSWLLRRIGGGVPIALNPGWDIGMDFDADMVAQLLAQLPPEHKT